ncbi:MAG: DNA recombination protein RmuC [Bdellovibrio sp.]|nr:DNA recombination protein RmuC [Bdellovibrio sp.]
MWGVEVGVLLGGLALGLALGWFVRHKNAEKEKAQLQQKMLEVEKVRIGLEHDLKNIKESQGEKERLSQLHFEQLAHKIFEDKQKSFQEMSTRGLQGLLNPFKDRLAELQKKVEETYEKEGREVFSLRQEILRMMEMGRKMENETKNLTMALKGDVKAQGNWGELVLEKILEHSGLRSGEEYIAQAEGMNLKSEDGRALRPDVIIKLPEGKNLVIDSKVSLVSYDRLIAATTEEERNKHKRDFLVSVKGHIEILAGKNYQAIEGLTTPDFVLMFAPIEGALSMILEGEKDLFTYGWDRKIILVGPTTLLATLRTVTAIWKQERQHKNALQIAEVGGRLYDKFASFVDDFDRMGKYIKDLQTQHDTVTGKLKHGRGNLMVSVEKLRELGVKSTKVLKDVSGEELS